MSNRKRKYSTDSDDDDCYSDDSSSSFIDLSNFDESELFPYSNSKTDGDGLEFLDIDIDLLDDDFNFTIADFKNELRGIREGRDTLQAKIQIMYQLRSTGPFNAAFYSVNSSGDSLALNKTIALEAKLHENYIMSVLQLLSADIVDSDSDDSDDDDDEPPPSKKSKRN